MMTTKSPHAHEVCLIVNPRFSVDQRAEAKHIWLALVCSTNHFGNAALAVLVIVRYYCVRIHFIVAELERPPNRVGIARIVVDPQELVVSLEFWKPVERARHESTHQAITKRVRAPAAVNLPVSERAEQVWAKVLSDVDK